MNQIATPAIPRLHVGRGAQYASLTLFPVWAEGGSAAGLEWGLEHLRVGEQPGGARVDALVAVNEGPRPVVLLEGDLLEGGWQTRMVARSTILPPRSMTEVAALCVEQGRWGGHDEHRARGRRVSATLRTARDRAAREGQSAQHAVWEGIAARYETRGATPTNSFAEHLDRRATRGTASPRPLPAKPLAGQRGVIIGVGGRVLGMELFATHTALLRRWAGIVEAAAFDADGAPEVATPGQQARDFAGAVERQPAAARRPHDGVRGEAPADVVELEAAAHRLRLAGLAMTEPERTVDGEFWRIVHLAARDEAHPILVGA